MEAPETRYVAVGDGDVAYQVVGEGPVDLLYCYGLGSHVDFNWHVPSLAAAQSRLASFLRLIVFDRRGTGASDAVERGAVPTVEGWTEDMEAVLDAADSERAAILALTDMGPMAVLYAAMHPERVSSLVLFNTAARYIEDDDYTVGAPVETADALVRSLASTRGTREFVALANPSAEPDLLTLMAQATRACSTPRSTAAQYEYILRHDVRHILPLVQVPTLVVHVKDSLILPIDHGRYLAEHIDGATFVEVQGNDMGWTPANYWVIDEIAAFVTGERPAVEVDRILTTVLFTDIVESTAHAASLGDQRWRSLLDAHDKTVREQLRRFRGREINTTGDGFVASFDGPARATRCAQAVVEASGKLGIELRAGLHTGECEVRGDDLGGLAVHIAARVGALAGPGEVLVSSTVKDLVVGSGIEFNERGEHELKGVPGMWRLYSAEG